MIDDDLLARALLDRQIADAEHIAQAKTIQSQDADLSLYHALIHHEIMPEAPIVALVAELLGLPALDLDSYTLDAGVTGMLSSSMATRAQALPLELRDDGAGQELLLAMIDPFDLDSMDEVAVHTGINIQPVLVGPRALARALARAYPYGASAPAEPARSVGQEDSWAMFFEGNSLDAPAPKAEPPALVPQLGAEDSAAIAQDMRDRPTSMEFDLLDLEADPQPPMMRTMYLEDEDFLDLSPAKKPKKGPPATPPAPPAPPITARPAAEPRSYADIGNFFVDNDLRQSASPKPSSPEDDADFFDSFFSEESLRAPVDAAPPLELEPDRFDAPISSPQDDPKPGIFRLDDMASDVEMRGPSSIIVAEEEEFLLEEPIEHHGNRTSIASPRQLASIEPLSEPEHEPEIELNDPIQPAPVESSARAKLGQLRARLAASGDEPATSNTSVASPAMLGDLISEPAPPAKPAEPEPAPELSVEPEQPAEPAPRKLSLGKLGSSLGKLGNTQVASPAAISAGLSKKPEPVKPAEPEPAPPAEPASEPAPALGKLAIKKVPARPAAIEEHYASKPAPEPATRAISLEPATRAFSPEATTREMTDADLFSFAPGPEPASPRPLGAQNADEEAMLEESTRAQVATPLASSAVKPGPAPISGRSSTDPNDMRETSANVALTRAALLRMSRDPSPELELPPELSERQLLHAALSLLIEHKLLTLDELIERAKKL